MVLLVRNGEIEREEVLRYAIHPDDLGIRLKASAVRA
jgi:hypothetical protein